MSLNKFTRREVEAHAGRHDAMIIIDNLVYDVTTFLEEHPGGPEVLLANAGKDASDCFYGIGHSQEARDLRRRYLARELEDHDRRPEWSAAPALHGEEGPSLGGLVQVWAPPLALAVSAALLYVYLFT